jgi:hypothetical protein
MSGVGAAPLQRLPTVLWTTNLDADEDGLGEDLMGRLALWSG